jgi:hypothetical protein
MNFKPNARTREIIIQELTDETLIYDLENNKAFCLNKTAARIWKNCDGKKDLENLANELGTAKETILVALDGFQKNDLLTSKTDLPIPEKGLERRKFLIKAGTLSAIALPIISSLTAPRGIHAQSCVGTNGFVPGSGSPDTTQASAMDCQNNCGAVTPDGSASCCAMSGSFTWAFTAATSNCQCPGYQCN